MEHIKNILAARKHSLFAAREGRKGSSEWSAFSTIRHDQIEMFSVATPRKKATPRYTNVVPIHRYPRHLTPRIVQ